MPHLWFFCSSIFFLLFCYSAIFPQYQSVTFNMFHRIKTFPWFKFFIFIFYLFMIVTERERERERERGRVIGRGRSRLQAEGEAGSMHREPDVGFDPGFPGSRPGPKAGAKPLRHPGIPEIKFFTFLKISIPLSFCPSCSCALALSLFQVNKSLKMFFLIK